MVGFFCCFFALLVVFVRFVPVVVAAESLCEEPFRFAMASVTEAVTAVTDVISSAPPGPPC